MILGKKEIKEKNTIKKTEEKKKYIYTRKGKNEKKRKDREKKSH